MTTLDYIILCAYLLATLAFGVWLARRNKSEEDYLLGGGSLRPWALGLSLFASLLSTITFLMVPGEMIKHGPIYLAELIAFPLIFLVAGYVVVPRIVREPVTSAYEILEKRLGSEVRVAAEAMFLVARFGWMALILHATSQRVLIPMLAIDRDWVPLATAALAAALGALTVAYTAWGGFRAVVYTDVTQAIILFGGAIGCILLAAAKTGGVADWWPTTRPESWREIAWINARGDQRPFIAMILYGFTWFVATNGADQVAVQRHLATRDVKSSRRTLAYALAAQVSTLLVLAVLGFGILRFYTENPDKKPEAEVVAAQENASGNDAATQHNEPYDKYFPTFIIEEVPAGATGLIIAALLAAAMSSLSSGVNAVCSVVAIRFLPRESERQQHSAAPARWIAVAAGVIAIAIAVFVIPYVQGNLLVQAAKIVNLLVAPLFGLFVMALFVPRATVAGTLVGAVFGVGAAVQIMFWEELHGEEGPISIFYGMPLSLAVQVAMGTAVSWVMPGEPTQQL